MSFFSLFLTVTWCLAFVFSQIEPQTLEYRQWSYPCNNSLTANLPFCNTSLTFSERSLDYVLRLSLSDLVKLSSNTNKKLDSLGISGYQFWSEALHGIAKSPGIRYAIDANVHFTTMFPQVIGTASSLNRTLWNLIGNVISNEGRALYNLKQGSLTFWSPNVNIFRDPRWGRGQETQGEDPFIASEYAKEFVNGIEGNEHLNGYLKASACCKHFSGYSLENYNGVTRHEFNAIISQYDLNDTYFPAFKSCIINGNVSCIMCSYNSVNGIPSCANDYFNNQMLKNEWKFNGYITSDCDSIYDILYSHHYTSNIEQTDNVAYKAGTTLDCGVFLEHSIEQLVLENKLDINLLRNATYINTLVQMRLGLFDPPQNIPWNNLGKNDICSDYNLKLSYSASQQSIVLLKNNNNILPMLDYSKYNNVLLLGSIANSRKVMTGNYNGFPPFIYTVKDGLETYINLTYNIGGFVGINDTKFIPEAVELAKNSDLIFIVGGLDQTQEREGHDRIDLLLHGSQNELIENIISSKPNNTPIILILLSGGCIDISQYAFNDNINGILWVGYPGMYGGLAIADIIFGKYNPIGRLTQTWYYNNYTLIKSMYDMNMRPNVSNNGSVIPGRGYRYFSGNVLYKFGYGLQYTKFICNNFSISSDMSYASINILNTGNINSGGSLLLYFILINNGKNGYPLKRLIGFNSFDILNINNEINVKFDFYKEWINSQESKMNGTFVIDGSCSYNLQFINKANI